MAQKDVDISCLPICQKGKKIILKKNENKCKGKGWEGKEDLDMKSIINTLLILFSIV